MSWNDHWGIRLMGALAIACSSPSHDEDGGRVDAGVSPGIDAGGRDGSVERDGGAPPPDAGREECSAEWQHAVVGADNSLNDAPAIGIDASGGVHVVFREGEDARYARRAADGAWSTETIEADVGESDLTGGSEAVALYGGEVHAAYVDYLDGALRYAHRDLEGAWTSETIAGASGPAYSFVADGEGGVHMLHGTASGSSYAYLAPGGQWESHAVDTGGASAFCTGLRLDDGGGVHFACLHQAPETITRAQVVYVHYVRGEAFDVEVALDAGRTVHGIGFDRDAEGGLHALVATFDGVTYGYRSATGGAWSNEAITSAFWHSLVLRADADGQPHAIWVSSVPGNPLVYATRGASGWTASEIPGTSSMEHPQLVVRSGELVIGFSGYAAASLARKASSGGAWEVEALSAQLGMNARMVITAAGRIHMVDQQLADHALHHYTSCL